MISDTLGIVVIGRNEGQRLINCLMSINADRDRIVYVDSGSTDGSPEAAERFGVSVVRLDAAQPFTAARGRNEGFTLLKRLKPEIRLVQFVDGDCELDNGWLGTASAFIAQREDVAVVCGRRRERHPEASIYNRLCDIEWDTPVGETTACGGDALIRVEAFEAVGGFRAQLIAGEEPELCLRLRVRGWKVWRLGVEMTRHDAAMTQLRQWWRRAVRSGYSLADVARLHSSGVYGKEMARVGFWGALLPLAIGISALAHPLALWGTVLYPLQISRVALRRGVNDPESWTYALFMMLGKFAELEGILRFHWRRWRGQRVELIDYKKVD